MKSITRLFAAALFFSAPHLLPAQERGVGALTQQVRAVGGSMRVLIVGAHPDDEDTQLIAWLTHGRHVETAYLSLTRGDGGQNLIGNELGEALGVIRTAELMAARRIDGAQQYFTRAFDFGFSKDTADTFRHWPKDSLLRDVVRVVRDFAPHVIVAVFSGTPRDGHGQHQVSAILAKDVWTAAEDTVRFPVGQFGPAWTPLKFYRGARFSPGEATLRINVGEYNPVLGKSYAEIAAESRSQHKSQGFGTLQRKGVIWDWLRREETRVAAPTDPKTEQTMFDGIDTGLTRLHGSLSRESSRPCRDYDSLFGSLSRMVLELDKQSLSDRAALVSRLAAIQRGVEGLQSSVPGEASSCGFSRRDLQRTLAVMRSRVNRAIATAADVTLESFAGRPAAALGDTFTISSTVFNRGVIPVRVRGGATGNGALALVPQDSSLGIRLLWNDATLDGKSLRPPGTQPTWLRVSRNGDLFGTTADPMDALNPGLEIIHAFSQVEVDSTAIVLSAPISFRFADPVRGDVQLPFAVTPGIAVSFDRTNELARAAMTQQRTFNVTLRSSYPSERVVNVRLELPSGMRADSSTRSLAIAPGASRAITFSVSGRLKAGVHTISAVAESGGETFTTGYVPIQFEHIPPLRMYRPAQVQLSSIPVDVPVNLKVAYVPGVGDNVPSALRDLGISVTNIEPRALSATELAVFSAVVVGPRAYQANRELIDNNSYLLDYARNGGTVVVQYGQYEMAQPGVMPYPVSLARPAERVTDETAAVTITDATSSLLAVPNRISVSDFSNWVQERALYMPATFDANYKTVMSMNDPGESAKTSGILVTPLGRGLYIYTTLSFFRQLPAGNAGATRLFVNLISAKRTQ